MEITKERRIAIIAAALVILIFSLYIFLYAPLIAKLKITYAEFSKYNTELKQAQATIAGAKKIDTKKVFITEKAMITEEGISAAIAELTRQKKLHDIDFISITPGEIEKQKDPRYKIMPIKIKTESTYEKLGTFLGFLDDLKEGLVTVKSFKITSLEGNPERLVADLVLNLYLSTEYAE